MALYGARSQFAQRGTTPRGPKGEKRPADLIGNAVRVMQIATGEREEEYETKPPKDEAAASLDRKGGAARTLPR
jgi:hypothetical protein